MPEIEVVVSNRRKKSASAKLQDGKIVVQVPDHLTQTQIDEIVTKLAAKLQPATDLQETAEKLQREYFPEIKKPFQVHWSERQKQRWGSCSYNGEIRISSRLKHVPLWVLEAVIVHELAHLKVRNHSLEFKKLTARYPRYSEALIYLQGYGLGLTIKED